jgi:hypothetical protein
LEEKYLEIRRGESVRRKYKKSAEIRRGICTKKKEKI